MEQHGIFRIDGIGSRQHGAVGSRWQTCDDGRVQGGGVVWRHGDVDGSPGKVNALIRVLKMGRRKMTAADSGA